MHENATQLKEEQWKDPEFQHILWFLEKGELPTDGKQAQKL